MITAGKVPAVFRDRRLGLVLLAVFAARLPSLWEPRWAHDEGTLAAVADGLLHGGRLYVDVWDNQQPLVYGWMAVVLAVTHAWHPGMQLVLALQVLVATACVYGIAQRIGARPAAAALLFGLVAALPIVEGNLQNVEVIGLPFLLGGVYLGLSGGVVRAVAGGALLVLAYLCQPGLGVEALCVPWFLLLSGKPVRLLPLALGGAAAGLLAWWLLWSAGSWDAYRGIAASERAYLVWANGGAELAPITLALRLIPIGAALVAGLRIGWEQKTAAARLLGAWLPLAVLVCVTSPRGFMHYSLLALAPLSLLLGLWVDRRLFVPVAIGLVLMLQSMLYLPRLEMFIVGPWPIPKYEYADFGWARLPGYYRDWYDRAIGVISWPAYAETFPDHPASVEELAAAMRVQGTLFVWGDEPWLYVLSDRRPAGKYVNLNSAWKLEPRAQADAVGFVRGRRPEYLVVEAKPPSDLTRLLSQQYDRLRFMPGPWIVYGLHSG